jgi:DNA-binding GntR family transcriptional regulator
MTPRDPQKEKARWLREIWRSSLKNGALSEIAYLTLREAIFQNVLSEGEPVRERWLCEVLNISRTPVREALQRLEAEGLVKHFPGLGVVVTRPTIQDIEEIYSIRIVLEGLSAFLAASFVSESDIAVLESIQEKIDEAEKRLDIESLTILNARFHDALARAGRNERLRRIVNLLHDAVQRVNNTTLGYPARASQASEEHRAILEAVKRRDPESARRLAEEHMAHAKLVRLAMYSTAGLEEVPR